MAEELAHRLEQSGGFGGRHQEAMIHLLAAAAAVRGELEKACCRHDIFASQYNILRILAEAPDEGYPRSELIEQMIDRCPDVTRLVDPLEKKGLVQRQRSKEDRRVVLHRITGRGRRLLETLSSDLAYVQNAFRKEFTGRELEEFSHLCAAVYQRFDEACRQDCT